MLEVINLYIKLKPNDCQRKICYVLADMQLYYLYDAIQLHSLTQCYLYF